jgi:hypothetical protein
MSTDAENRVNAKPKRRWLQFSLRTLIVLMLAVGCGFGWLAHEIGHARIQRKAATEIEELGGSVEFEDVTFPTARAWLGKFCGEDLPGDVTDVSFAGTRVSDEGLVHLQAVTQLRCLALNDTQVSGAGLAWIPIGRIRLKVFCGFLGFSQGIFENWCRPMLNIWGMLKHSQQSYDGNWHGNFRIAKSVVFLGKTAYSCAQRRGGQVFA